MTMLFSMDSWESPPILIDLCDHCVDREPVGLVVSQHVREKMLLGILRGILTQQPDDQDDQQKKAKRWGTMLHSHDSYVQVPIEMQPKQMGGGE